MAQLKFSGPAVVTGFPRNEIFGFEVEGDRLVIKAGKSVFLTIEKELPEQVSTGLSIVPSSPIEYTASPAETNNPKGKFDSTPAAPETAAQTEPKTRKPRSPSVTISDGDFIQVDPTLANPYAKLRGKYFESLQTANGRTVKWWQETAMVKALEGSPAAMLRFFLSEKTVSLISGAGEDRAGSVQGVPQAVSAQGPAPITPGFGAAAIAGAQWTPPGGQTPPDGPRFM